MNIIDASDIIRSKLYFLKNILSKEDFLVLLIDIDKTLEEYGHDMYEDGFEKGADKGYDDGFEDAKYYGRNDHDVF
jgi:hypothetical protein